MGISPTHRLPRQARNVVNMTRRTWAKPASGVGSEFHLGQVLANAVWTRSCASDQSPVSSQPVCSSAREDSPTQRAKPSDSSTITTLRRIRMDRVDGTSKRLTRVVRIRRGLYDLAPPDGPSEIARRDCVSEAPSRKALGTRYRSPSGSNINALNPMTPLITRQATRRLEGSVSKKTLAMRTGASNHTNVAARHPVIDAKYAETATAAARAERIRTHSLPSRDAAVRWLKPRHWVIAPG